MKKILYPAYLIISLVIFFISLMAGTFRLFIYLFQPRLIASGGESDQIFSLEISFGLAILFSLILSYFLGKKRPKMLGIFYPIFFVIIFLCQMYILRYRY